MPAGDAIEFGLQGEVVGLFLIKCEFSSTGVTTERRQRQTQQEGPQRRPRIGNRSL